jgi:hypothetical protein
MIKQTESRKPRLNLAHGDLQHNEFVSFPIYCSDPDSCKYSSVK